MEEALANWLGVGAVRKSGEGTFGEAYKCPGVVLKIVPMEGDLLVNGEPQKGARDMLAEAVIALQLSALRAQAQQPQGEVAPNMTSTFVQTQAVAVTCGPYAPELLKVRWAIMPPPPPPAASAQL